MSVITFGNTVHSESNSTSVEIPLLAWDKSPLIGDAVFYESILDDAERLTEKDSVQDLVKRFRNRYGPETTVIAEVFVNLSFKCQHFSTNIPKRDHFLFWSSMKEEMQYR